MYLSQDDLTKSNNTAGNSHNLSNSGPVSLRKSKNNVNLGAIQMETGVVFITDEEKSLREDKLQGRLGKSDQSMSPDVVINTYSSSSPNIEKVEGAGPKTSLKVLQREIANLYLKIKRCSKDVSITESQYIQNVETAEDRKEKEVIYQLDPMVVLQYINVSIDVIINLKFEDIESKMLNKAELEESSPGHSQIKRSKAVENLKELRNSLLDNIEVQSLRSSKNSKREFGTEEDGYEMEETPKKIREQMG
jgi:hypothetical protein